MGGIIDKLKGTAMQVEGKITNDNVRVVQGTAIVTKGRLESAISRFVQRLKRSVARATKTPPPPPI